MPSAATTTGSTWRFYYHVPGTPQADDALSYAVKGQPTRDPYGTVTPDGRFLVLAIEDGYLTNGVYYQRLGGQRPAGRADLGPW